MKRIPHKLTRNEITTRPQFMIFVDVETEIKRVSETETEYPFVVGYAHYWRKRRDGQADQHEPLAFKDIGTFWDWVDRHCYKNSVTYLIAHNLLFDLAALNFLEELPSRGWKPIFTHHGPSCAIYKWRRDDRTLCCLNNANIFKGALEDWANAVGLKKVEINWESTNFGELAMRCKRDVAIMVRLWDWWLKFLDEHDLGMFKPTIASQAFTAYRHRFMKHPIYLHNDKDVLELERQAYRGGRTEPFFIGKATDGPYYKLDINSMYPYVMQKFEYPNCLVAQGTNPELQWLWEIMERYGVIAEVTLDVDEPWFPVQRNGYNVYPIGMFKTVLTTEELKLALGRGWVLSAGRFALYRMRDLFSEFVHYLYDLKIEYSEGDREVLRQVVKDMLNLLHGKFGQRGRETKVIGEWVKDDNFVAHSWDPETGQPVIYRYIGGQVLQETATGESFNSFPAISAHVAANARLELYKLVKKAGERHCLYCDTDSLIVDQEGLDNLKSRIHPTLLGGLKLEEVADEVEIRAPKDYRFGDREVVKGIPRLAEWVGENQAITEIWPGLVGYLNSGIPPTYRTVKVIKTLRRFVNHGWVGKDGWVRPFKYPEDKK